MDPINPWLDADELKQLAQSLLPPKPITPAPAEEAGFNDGFVGFTADPTSAIPTPVTSPTPPASNPAPIPAASPAPAMAPAIEAITATPAPTPDYELTSDELFILDASGKPVHGAKLLTAYHGVASELIQNARRRGLPKGHVHMKIGPGRTLELLPLPHPKEQWIAGLIVPSPLDPDCIESLANQVASLVAIN